MGTITLAARVLLGLVFAGAALTKLPNPGAARDTFRAFGAGETLARTAGLLAPAELGVAVGLGFVPTARWAGAGAGLLLLVFIGGMANALRLGRHPDCGCFGGLRPAPIGTSTLVRNGLLLAVAGWVVATGPGPAVDLWIGSHGPAEVAGTAGIVLLAAGAIVLGGGSDRTTSTAVVPPLSVGRSAPRVGETAPSFATTDTAGAAQSLSALCALGEPVVLVFAGAGCGSCAAVLSHLARWQTTMAGRLRFAVVGNGDADQAMRLCEEYGLAGVLVDDERRLGQAYGVTIIPTAFTISPAGRIVLGPAVGPDAVEELIRLSLHGGEPMLGPWTRTITAV